MDSKPHKETDASENASYLLHHCFLRRNTYMGGRSVSVQTPLATHTMILEACMHPEICRCSRWSLQTFNPKFAKRTRTFLLTSERHPSSLKTVPIKATYCWQTTLTVHHKEIWNWGLQMRLRNSLSTPPPFHPFLLNSHPHCFFFDFLLLWSSRADHTDLLPKSSFNRSRSSRRAGNQT